MRRHVRAVGPLLLAGSLAACGSDDPGNSCVAPPGCDITNVNCQRAVFRATACERGQTDETTPPVRTISPEAFDAELTAAKTDPSPGDADWEAAFHLLGLLAPDQGLEDAANATASANVLAYYDSDTKRVTVIERDSTDPANDMYVLSHEFVHALQDRSVDLTAFEKKWETSTDARVAVRSLVEGEAVVLSLQVYAHAFGGAVNWSGLSSGLFDSTFQALDAASAPLPAAALLLPYPVGATGLTSPYLANGPSGIAALYDAPRVSVLDWELDAPATETNVREITCLPTIPPSGYAGTDHDTLGVAGILAANLRTSHTAAAGYANARTWRGDVMVTFTPSDAADTNRAVAWRTEWNTLGDAAAFAKVAGSLSQSARVVEKDLAVTVFAATDPAALAAWDTESCGTAADLPSPPPEAPPTQTSAVSARYF